MHAQLEFDWTRRANGRYVNEMSVEAYNLSQTPGNSLVVKSFNSFRRLARASDSDQINMALVCSVKRFDLYRRAYRRFAGRRAATS